ncbi:tetratricopeptide repeat protein [candidate division TA06 bacterium]|uniref:Tetratricopeptide repeat protein n=1 Tax=candidate division TA06 bacterium TaxID=2250710 RepID=A0A933IDX8_UNCT6|nr:tetratricopeptide repeat protein [candidate division TA06 bacterium]
MPHYNLNKHWIQFQSNGSFCYYPYSICREKAALLKLIGNWQAAEDIFRANLEAALKSLDARSIAQAKTDLSAICDTRGKEDEAFTLAQEASWLWEKLNQTPGRVKAMGTMGNVYQHRSEYPKAMECYNACLELSRRAGLDKDTCRMLNMVGLISYEMGDLEKALKFYGESLEIARRNNEPQYIAMASGNIGNVYLETGRWDQAMECYQRALKESQRAGDKQAIAFGVGNIAIIYEKKGEYDKAMEWTRRQYDTFTELGDQVHLSVTLLNLGNIYLDTGRLDPAVESFTRQIAISEGLKDKPILSYGNYMLGIAHSEKGNFDEAQKALEQAIEVGRSIGFNHYVCGYLVRLAKLYLENGRPGQALALIPEARKLAQEVKRPDVLLDLDVVSARAAENKEMGKEQLKALLAAAAEEQKAEILLQLWRLGAGEEYREQAAGQFKMLYEQTPKYQYQKSLAELT